MEQSIGQRIRKIRVNKDLSQQEVADELGITPGAYAKIERGETDPQASRLYELAQIFKVDISELMKDKPDPAVSAAGQTQLELIYSQLNLLTKEVERLRAEVVGHKKKS